jgi:hypothetical protein
MFRRKNALAGISQCEKVPEQALKEMKYIGVYPVHTNASKLQLHFLLPAWVLL